jgi:O-antigen/teichoic acid export membrane protein
MLASKGGRRVFLRVGILLLLTALSQACGFGILLSLARCLPPEDLGIFLFALGLQGYLMLLGSGGAGSGVVRELAGADQSTLAGADQSKTGQAPEQADEWITAYLTLTAGTTLAVTSLALLGWFLTPTHAEERTVLLWILLGNIPASISLLPLFDAGHRQHWAAATMLLVDLLTLASFALLAGSTLLTLPIAGLLMAAKWTLTALAQFALLRVVWPFRWQVRAARLRTLAASGWPLVLAGFLILAPLTGGVILTRLFRSPAEAAVAGLATQAALVYATACGQVTRIAQPFIMAPDGVRPWFIRQLVFGVGAAILALGLGIAGLAFLVILLFLPVEYQAVLQPLTLMLLAGVPGAAAGILVLYLNRQRRESAVLAGYLAGGLVFGVAGVVATASLGPAGAALAALLASLVTLAVLGRALRMSPAG